MILDFEPLSVTSLRYALATFVGLVVLIIVTLILKPPKLQVTGPTPTLYYVGLPLIAVTVIFSSLLLPPGLRAGLLLASLGIAIGGRQDEKRSLAPPRQFFWQLTAAVAAVSLGWTIPYVTHPLYEGILRLDWSAFGPFMFPGSVIAVVWLLLLMNAINWLDGADGLASGVGIIAFVTLGIISLLPATQDSTTLSLSLIGLGAMGALLIWNWPPAKIYLGTTGSWFLGLYIGLVAIIGGGKIATTLLVLALPIIDAIFVIFQRLVSRQKPWQGGDRRHLHHRLQAHGMSGTTLTLVAMLCTATLGVAALQLYTWQKIAAVGIAALLLGALLVTLTRHVPHNH